jgi:hypothetical protein
MSCGIVVSVRPDHTHVLFVQYRLIENSDNDNVLRTLDLSIAVMISIFKK